jgi:hypothetical protein
VGAALSVGEDATTAVSAGVSGALIRLRNKPPPTSSTSTTTRMAINATEGLRIGRSGPPVELRRAPIGVFPVLEVGGSASVCAISKSVQRPVHAITRAGHRRRANRDSVDAHHLDEHRRHIRMQLHGHHLVISGGLDRIWR